MENTTPIFKIMTPKPATVHPGDSLDKVRQIFERYGFHHAPVVQDHRLVGIVSYTDYLRVVGELFSQEQSRKNAEKTLHAVLVAEIMTPAPVCLSPENTLEDAMQVFRENRFHALPVVEGDQHLVGILSTHDLIKALEKVLAPEIDYAA